MKAVAYRIAPNGYDAMVLGFDRPCMISLYERNLSPLCGASDRNDQNVFRYASHTLEDEQNKDLHPRDYNYPDGLTVGDFYHYHSTIDLSHLTHEQHKAMYSAVAEINDVTDRSSWIINDLDCDEDEKEFAREELKRTDVIEINLNKCRLKFADGTKATYSDLH